MDTNLAPTRPLVNLALIIIFLSGGCASPTEADENLVERAQEAKEADDLAQAQDLAQQAIDEGEQIYQSQKILADLARRRAAIAAEAGDFTGAFEALIQAAEVEPARRDRADDLVQAVHIGHQAGLDEGHLLPLAIAALDGRPHDAELHREIARMAEDQGQRGLAIEHYLWLFSADPDDHRAGFRLGVLYLAEDRPADAASVLRRVVDADPDNTQAALILARAYKAMSRHDEAADLFVELTKRFPDNPAILRQYADFEEDRGNRRRARELREQAEDAQTTFERRDMRPLR